MMRKPWEQEDTAPIDDMTGSVEEQTALTNDVQQNMMQDGMTPEDADRLGMKPGSMTGGMMGMQPVTAQPMAQDAQNERVASQPEQQPGGSPSVQEGPDMLVGQMTERRIMDAEAILRKYKAGKAKLERRVIHAQQWWKLRNWQEMETQEGLRGSGHYKSNTAWLWNCIIGKHADAMDAFPEPVILPRAEDDKEESKRLNEIVPVVLQENGFEETFSDCAWQKLQEGTGIYAVSWDKDKLNGMGDISVNRVNVLNMFW